MSLGHYNDYRIPRSGWFRHVVTVSVLVRHVMCLDCGERVGTVRTRDVDDGARTATMACRAHRRATGHRNYRIADGRMVEQAEKVKDVVETGKDGAK